MKDVKNPVFLDTPARFFEEGIQLVVPSLATLLARAPMQMQSHLLPLERTDFGDHLQQCQVLIMVPSPLLGSLARLGGWFLLILEFITTIRSPNNHIFQKDRCSDLNFTYRSSSFGGKGFGSVALLDCRQPPRLCRLDKERS
jgi:hypothetical protein